MLFLATVIMLGSIIAAINEYVEESGQIGHTKVPSYNNFES